MAARSARGRAGRRTPTKRATQRPTGGVVFDLAKHGGKWVATQRGAVLAVSRSLENLERILDEMGVGNDVVLTKVPSSGEFVL